MEKSRLFGKYRWIIPLMLFVLFLSEIILKVSLVLGFFSYFILITGILIVFSNLDFLKDCDKLLVCFMIFPMFRVASLFVNLDVFWGFFLKSYIFLFLVIFYFFIFNMKLKGKFRPFLIFIIVVLGIVIGFFGDFFLDMEKNLFLIIFLPLIVFSEEIFLKLMIQEEVEKVFGRFFAVVFTSFFCFVVCFWMGFYGALFFLGVGIVSCFVYAFTRDVYLGMILNFFVSFFVFVL